MHPCCSRGDTAATAVTAPGTTRRSWPRRVGALVEWALPVTALALVPKCPGCVAAYILLFTGVGLSLPAATSVRWALIGVSIGALVFLGARAVYRRVSAP